MSVCTSSSVNVCPMLYKPWADLLLLTLPFKSLGALQNVLVFERKAIFFGPLSIKITSN